MKIVVVDDEQGILDAVEHKLRREGCSVFTASTAEEGLQLFKQVRPDILLLDVMLPGQSGFDLCKTIRETSQVPIIFLTAKTQEEDRVEGLEIGADDYLVKPFSLAELWARVKSVMRRATTDHSADDVEIAGLRISPSTHAAELEGKKLDLSPKEFALLHFLAGHPRQVFSRDSLLDRVWGQDAFVEPRTVDVHISWLRRHIEPDPSKPIHLITVRGVGYKFEA